MLIFDRHAPEETVADFSVSLPFDKRVRGRLRITPDGHDADAGINVERGELLREGSKLGCESGQVLLVRAQAESVSVATTSDRLLFARACYHVGNRHTQVQIDEQRLVYLHDHVLDDMLSLLGLVVSSQELPFEPENGAYAGGHAHEHDNSRHDYGSQ